jgi:hypothetical protein
VAGLSAARSITGDGLVGEVEVDRLRQGESGGMKRKRKSMGPFVVLPLAILNTPAWRAMNCSARVLWIELRRKLRNDRLNNGKIYLSCRAAAKAIGGNKDTIAHRFAELEHYGFLRKTAEGFLGVDGRGIAPYYRFTDLAHVTHPATRDYEKWDGSIFEYTPRRPGRKKQNAVQFSRTPRPVFSDIRKASNGGSVCPGFSDIGEAPKCPGFSDISRISICPGRAEGLQGSSTVRAPAQAGGAGSSPAPVSSLTAYVLSVVNAELERLKMHRPLQKTEGCAAPRT